MENHPGDTLGTRFLTFWGAILAFFGFALFAILLQRCSSGLAEDPRNQVRVANRLEIIDAGQAELDKMGWGADHGDALKAAVALAKGRTQSETKSVVPEAAPPAEEGEGGETKDGGNESTEDAPEKPAVEETPPADKPAVS